MKENKVILNGEYVDPDRIDPHKHKFIGTFRPPRPPEPESLNTSECICGELLWKYTDGYGNRIWEHYRCGHFDLPQYATIKES